MTLGWLLVQVLTPQLGGLDIPEVASLKAGIDDARQVQSMVIGPRVGMVIEFPVRQSTEKFKKNEEVAGGTEVQLVKEQVKVTGSDEPGTSVVNFDTVKS